MGNGEQREQSTESIARIRVSRVTFLRIVRSTKAARLICALRNTLICAIGGAVRPQSNRQPRQSEAA